MKHLLTIILLTLKVFVFGQDTTCLSKLVKTDSFLTIKGTSISSKRIATFSTWYPLWYKVSDSTEFRINDKWEIEVSMPDYVFTIKDSCGDFAYILTNVLLERLIKESELQRKIRYYEDYYGIINGSLDGECINMLPPRKERKSCPIDKPKVTPKKTISTKHG